MFVLSGCVNERHGVKTTIVRARRPIDAAVVAWVWWHQACSGLACRCELSCVKVGLVMACINHARAGTELDQRQRRGMHFGPVWRGVLLQAVASHGPSRRVMAGRGSKTTTRSARFRLQRRMVGCCSSIGATG